MFFKKSVSILNTVCIHSICFLALSWTAGLILGMFGAESFIGFSFDADISHSQPTFFSLIAVSLLPFISALAVVALNMRPCILILAIIEGASAGFFLTSMCLFSATAGWFCILFLMFSKIFTLSPLFLFWNTCLHNSKRMIFRFFCICCLYASTVSYFDIAFVVPFFSILSNQS